MPKHRLADIPIHWSVTGEGPRRVLFLHCSLAHGGAWANVIRTLGDGITAVAMDMPGHGQSGSWPGTGDIHRTTTEIAADLADEGADLVGHSFGATVALRLAIEHPKLVRSLTLIEPVYFVLAEGTPEKIQHDKDYGKVNRALAAGDPEKAARAFTGDWGTGQHWDKLPGQQRAYMTDRVHLVPMAEPAIMQDVDGVLAEGRLEKVKIPVLLIEGARTPAVIARVGDALERRLPNSRRIIIADASHMAPITHPQEVGAAIRDFFDDIP